MKPNADRGSALLVSLMVMVGLSLLGLTFVAISETENAISANERNKAQTNGLAEAGAKAVVQWFQDPATMEARGLLPANDDDFKVQRTVNAYTGYYNELRTHLSLDKDSPGHRPIQPVGQVVDQPILGGLHHQYCRM